MSLGAPLYAWSITNGLPALPLGRCFMMELLCLSLLAMHLLARRLPLSLNRPCEEGGTATP